MKVFVFVVVLVVVQAAVDNSDAAKNPGYDTAPLSKRQFSPKLRSIFNEGGLISANQWCREDAATLCGKFSSDNLLLLPCMQSQAEKVSDACHQLLWKYKVYLTTTMNVHVPLFEHCNSQLPRLPGCKNADFNNGEMVSCILNNKKNVTDKSCRLTIFRMQKIVFSDHRLIYGFNQACGRDIFKFKCGRVEKNETQAFDTGAENQGQVVACLEENIDKISTDCRDQIRKKEESAAENVELDVALFKACQVEVSVMCKSLPPGKGNLYRCLYDHMHEPTMKTKCRRQLMRRGKEESRDYRVNFKFTEACNKAIKRYSCDSEGFTAGSFTHTTSVLQCLNNHVDNDEELTDDCKAEMAIMVNKMMGNYQLDMALAAACDSDVVDHCSIEKNTRVEGGVISCLMKMEKNKKLTEACSAQVEQLVHAAAPTLTYSVDHISKKKCSDVYNKKCSDSPRKERFNCLMDHATDPDTSSICRSHLLTLQYFLARDYRMDEPLREACHDDIDKVCNLNYRSATVEYPPSHMLHCLYTSYLNPATKDSISSQCVKEVKRIMVIRSTSIDLNPYIDNACMEDLAIFCSGIDTSAPGEEFKCLQKNYDKIGNTDCHYAVANWTAMESEDVKMNRPLIRPCKEMIDKYCKNIPRGSGEVIHCLALNKNDLQFSEACRAQVVQFQMSVLTKYKFDLAFIKACGDAAHLLCDINSGKGEIMSCLRSKLADLTTRCRVMLRTEQLEKSENIKLNPKIASACVPDVDLWCSDVSPGQGKVLECLKKHFRQLIPPCAAAIEPQQAAAINDSRVDYVLMHNCKDEIEKFCSQVAPSDVIDCLITHKFKFAVNGRCKSAIVTREAIIFQEPTLNSKLWKTCGKDFHKRCSGRPNYAAIHCLASQLEDDKLSEACSNLMTQLLKEKQTDYRFNRHLIDECEGNKAFENCVSSNTPGHGSVIECLKGQLEALKSDSECQEAVSEMIKVASTNVKIDPILNQKCSEDISNFCGDVGSGKSKVILCLMKTLKNNKDKMSSDCISALTTRKGMWKNAKLNKLLGKVADGAFKPGPKRSVHTTSDDTVPAPMYSSSRNFWLLTCGAGVVIFVTIIFGRKCRKTTRKYT